MQREKSLCQGAPRAEKLNFKGQKNTETQSIAAKCFKIYLTAGSISWSVDPFTSLLFPNSPTLIHETNSWLTKRTRSKSCQSRSEDSLCSWASGRSSARAPCRGSAPQSHPQPAAPRCCSRPSWHAASCALIRTACAQPRPGQPEGWRCRSLPLQVCSKIPTESTGVLGRREKNVWGKTVKIIPMSVLFVYFLHNLNK